MNINDEALKNELRAQRNNALDMLANANGALANLQTENAALRERLSKAEEELGKLKA